MSEPQATIVKIADAMVLELNDLTRSWTGRFTAERVYQAIHDVSEGYDPLADLKVSVVPRGRPLNEKLTRQRIGGEQYKRRQHHRIDVAVQKWLPDRTKEEADVLQLLAEEIEEFFLGDEHRLATYAAARCIEGTIDPWPSQQHLDEHRVYTAVVQLTFEALI